MRSPSINMFVRSNCGLSGELMTASKTHSLFILMHEDNEFGRCGRTLLWISDHILHRALLSLPSSSSGYARGDREENISNNWVYWGTAHDVHIALLYPFASSIR
ncbi:hypothetical protein RIF29_43218 [Crotalaria pallida]|uniref:Uncharacterized protein n=1 Tax=Crotalaria pallida TaxID=3830 RepID=A0AAN9HR91_CROPI